MAITEALITGPAKRHVERTELTEKENGNKRSPAYILATTFINKGRDGFVRLGQKYKNRINIENNLFNDIPVYAREEAYVDYAGIIFGVSIKSLEHALVNKRISSKNIAEYYDEAIRGTFIPKWGEASDEDAEEISEDRHLMMLEITDAERPGSPDRALASFFLEQNYDLMPKSIQYLLESTKVLPIIRAKILPVHIDQTAVLVQERNTSLLKHKTDLLV